MIFDAHSDIWCDVTTKRLNGETDVFRRHHLARLTKGGVEGSILVMWIDPPYDADPPKRAAQILQAIREEREESTAFRIVHNYAEMQQAIRDGIFYVFIGCEGLSAIGEDLGKIDEYYEFGARHAILTWNEQNALGTGIRGDKDRGLTDLGRQAVRKIQDHHMILDVSHNNDKTFWDVMKASTAPVIASHSNCRTLCGVPRNLTDDMLRALRDTDGMVGVNSYNIFAADKPEEQNIDSLAKHVEHLVSIMDIDHVGFGFDFFEFCNGDAISACDVTDGAQKVTFPTPSVLGMKDASEIPNFLAVLRKVGFGDAELEKLCRSNWHSLIRRTIG